MKLIAFMNVMNGSSWVGYAIGSVYNAVDKIIVGHGPSTDSTGEILEAIRNLNPYKKVEIFDEVEKSADPRGSAGLKNRICRKALSYSPDWLFQIDHDHIFYDNVIDAKFRLSLVDQDVGLIRTEQIYLYAANFPNGSLRIPMKTPIIPNDVRVDQASFITFIRAVPTIHWTEPAHENLTGVQGRDTAMRLLKFVHTGPLDPEDIFVKKRIGYYRIEHLGENLSEEEIRDRLIGSGEIDLNGNSALKHRASITGYHFTEFKDVDFPLPEILRNYETGSSKKDIENIVNYIRSGR